jgi:hypothetical protein
MRRDTSSSGDTNVAVALMMDLDQTSTLIGLRSWHPVL